MMNPQNDNKKDLQVPSTTTNTSKPTNTSFENEVHDYYERHYANVQIINQIYSY
ncbi:MAG TPA: hypothetical protein VGM95_00040 [Lactobacillaceae bacterium]|jgi:hypothetical protein